MTGQKRKINWKGSRLFLAGPEYISVYIIGFYNEMNVEQQQKIRKHKT